MKKIIASIVFLLCALSLLAARPQPNLKKRLQETNAPAPSNTPIPLDTATPEAYSPTAGDWLSPTPSGDLYAVREGFPIGGYGPIFVTPHARPENWRYPMFVTPCWGWIDLNQVLFCVTATPAPLETNTPIPGYP